MGRVVASATPTARLLFTMRSYPASRILDTTQIGRLIAFSSATDVTIQRFNDSTLQFYHPVFLAISSMSAIGVLCHWSLAPPAATPCPSSIIISVVVLQHREQLRRGPLMRNTCRKS